jgi:hypothetical protein
LWSAYDTVCKGLGRTRAEDINQHIREQVRRHGGPAELELLKQAEAEVAERRSRQVGYRPGE